MVDLRQPILSLLGHVDHGKTTLLDRIAGSVRAEREAGGITQHIGAIEVPGSVVETLCRGVLAPGQLQVPGLLFIDTPGHRSFETLRRRGGALADLAILVVDSREGLMPQTRESIQILKHEKTPFVVALTKIDLLAGWRKPSVAVPLKVHLPKTGPDFERTLDARVYAVAEEMDQLGFSAERYDRVSDFTRNLGIVPVSAKTGVGLADLLALVVGLSQRFLSEELARGAAGTEATVLERTDEKGLGPVTSVVLYRGTLSVADEIVVTGRAGPFTSRIRGIYRPAPPRRGGGRGGAGPKLRSVDKVPAAAGVYIAAPGLEDALPGGLLKVFSSPEELETVQRELQKEAQPVADLAESGVALAADTLGGLEALAFECREAKVAVHSAEVGPVTRPLVVKAATMRDPTHRAVLAFNVPVADDARSEAASDVKVFPGEVMYGIIEEYSKWRTARQAELLHARRLELVHPAKLQVLPDYIFRISKPAIVGVKVLAGTLRPGVRLMRPDGVEVGVLRALQRERDSISQAEEGSEISASIEGAVIGRNVEKGDVLLVSLPEAAARHLKSQDLTPSERGVLDEVVRLRRATDPFWGQ